jgi:hypothetical protein
VCHLWREHSIAAGVEAVAVNRGGNFDTAGHSADC